MPARYQFAILRAGNSQFVLTYNAEKRDISRYFAMTELIHWKNGNTTVRHYHNRQAILDRLSRARKEGLHECGILDCCHAGMRPNEELCNG